MKHFSVSYIPKTDTSEAVIIVSRTLPDGTHKKILQLTGDEAEDLYLMLTEGKDD